jgi:hypothetical protein
MSNADDQRKAVLQELHKENSIFMNKVMIGIPSVGVPVVVKILSDANDLSKTDATFYTLSTLLFVLSVILLMYTFFVSEDAIDAVDSGDLTKGESKNNLVKRLHLASFYMTTVALLLILAVFLTPLIGGLITSVCSV